MFISVNQAEKRDSGNTGLANLIELEAQARPLDTGYTYMMPEDVATRLQDDYKRSGFNSQLSDYQRRMFDENQRRMFDENQRRMFDENQRRMFDGVRGVIMDGVIPSDVISERSDNGLCCI